MLNIYKKLHNLDNLVRNFVINMDFLTIITGLLAIMIDCPISRAIGFAILDCHRFDY